MRLRGGSRAEELSLGSKNNINTFSHGFKGSIDIVPDRTELIAYAHFGGYYYYATKWQVFGPCTVYVIDEKGLENLRNDFGDVYDIYTVLIKRDKALRRKSGIDETRLRRDERRDLKDEDYDYVIINNGKKAALFESIECIYEEIKNK